MFPRVLVFLCLFYCVGLSGQYTDQINSNRPGVSIGAFSVGKGVVQFESGSAYRSYYHSGFNQSSLKGNAAYYALRWGFGHEKFELTYLGEYFTGTLINRYTSGALESEQRGFLKNFIGFKWLLFDPYRKVREPNLYSWKANNSFQLHDLIPAVSLTGGANLNFFSSRRFPYGQLFSSLYVPSRYTQIYEGENAEPDYDFRLTLATQAHFLPNWVWVNNFTLNRLASPYPEFEYVVTLTHNIKPRWSVYVENQGIFSGLGNDLIFRSGMAYLISNQLQLELGTGGNIKTNPSIFLTNFGLSYRLDFHEPFEQFQADFLKAEKKENRFYNRQRRKGFKELTKMEKKLKRNEKKFLNKKRLSTK